MIRLLVVVAGLLVVAAIGLVVWQSDVVGGGPDRRADAAGGSASAGGSSQATAANSQSPPAKPKPERVTVSVSGDVLIHSPLWQQAQANADGGYDFAPMFEQIRPLIEDADLAVCHLETPLTRGQPTSYPIFATPAALTKALTTTGWDACSTASNHAVDGGLAGIAESISILDDAGIGHTGTYAGERASRKPLLLDAGGREVAWLAYTDATNGLPVPEPWAVGIADLSDPSNVLADAEAARRRGADAVIVNLHWGAEYASAPSADQVAYADALTDSEAITAIVGQGPHVVEPIDWMHDKPIVYSEGNLVSNQTPGCCSDASQDGLIAELELLGDGDELVAKRVRYVPIWVRHPDFVVVPAGAAVRAGVGDTAALRASYQRTVATAGRDGRTIPVPKQLP